MRTLLSFCVAGLPMVLTAACNGGGACDGGKYPAAPAGASETLYVSAACPAESADGTQDHPYASIGAAVAKAKAGAAVLVAAGTYPEQLQLTQDVTILGEATEGDQGADAAIILQSPDPYAVTVGAGATVTLQGLDVSGARGVGIWAEGGSATVDGCKIDGVDLYTDGGGSYGYGILASSGGAATVQDSTITGAAVGGVLFSGAPASGSSASGATGSVSGSSVADNQGFGIRLDQASPAVKIENTTLAHDVGFGVGVFSSGAIILQNHISSIALDANGVGDGIIGGADQGVSTPSSITANGNTISEVGRVGVLCAAGAGGIILQDNTISGAAASAPFGAGIWLQQGAGPGSGNTIAGNTLSANRFVGLGLTGDTGGIILQDNTIKGTTLGSTFVGIAQVSIGDGINVFSGATARITGNTVSGNGRFGLILDGEGSATTIQGNTIQDNDEYGIILQNQPATPPSTASNTFGGNKMGDVDTVAAGTFGIDASDFATQ